MMQQKKQSTTVNKVSTKSKRPKYIPLEEYIKTTMPCRNGRLCNNENCKFLHNVKTKMCKFAENCKRKTSCPFAHSKSELYIPVCNFGDKCKNEKCTYQHPKDFQWNATDKDKVIENNESNLTKHNFPKVIKAAPLSTKNVIKYKEMKEIISYVESTVIQEKTVEEMVDKYNTFNSFKEIKFQF